MLKLKQQQLQMTIRQVARKLRDVRRGMEVAQSQYARFRPVLSDVAGVNVQSLGAVKEIRTSVTNIAGVSVPVFEDATFDKAVYSLFSTPPWVDSAIADLRTLNRRLAEMHVLRQQYDLLDAELTKIIQRVNLFEKIKIPQAREIIRVIRIKLGDEMTAAVGRAKIAKAKVSLSEFATVAIGPDRPCTEDHEKES